MKKIIKRLREILKANHNVIMILCCAIPIILFIISYSIGLNNKYIFWLILISCSLMHYFMMKDMHNKNESHKN